MIDIANIGTDDLRDFILRHQRPSRLLVFAESQLQYSVLLGKAQVELLLNHSLTLDLNLLIFEMQRLGD